MAKLECFTINGISLWFWSNDHKPPHFHAKRAGKWEVRVYFLEESAANMLDVMWGEKAFTAADKKALAKMVAAHRANILEEWELKVNPDDN